MSVKMTNEAISRKVMDVQNEFLKRLHSNSTTNQPQTAPMALRLIHETNSSLMEFAFDSFGKILDKFIKSLDLDHPDIGFVFDGSFADGTDFSKRIIEFISLAQYAYDNDLKHIFPILGKLFVKESFDKNILKKMDTTNYNKCHVRLIRDPSEREEIRITKKMQIIDLQNVYKKGNEFWTTQPDCFTNFLRFDFAYCHEISKAEKKMRRYQELECITLAAEIGKSIQTFRDNMEQAYYGFNRITMTNVAIILAKFLGYTFVPSQHINCGGFVNTIDPKIYVDKSFFENCNFDPTSAFLLESTSSAYSNIKYAYEPKVYPFSELKSIAPESVMEIISTLDNFPDANGKPIFDHYGIIVPSIQYKLNYINDECNMIQNFSNSIDSSKALDKILIKGKHIHPIIIGEKDGKCFFICHWM